MKKTVILIVILVILIVLGTITYNVIQNMENVMEIPNINPKKDYASHLKDNEEENVDIVLTGEDTITKDSAWCGTFQLIWNDLKNDLAKQDIVFIGDQPSEVDNLNKEKFTVDDISDESYYKTYGAPTFKLKAEIEKAIKEKFNETSDILDSFTWQEEESGDYFLYAMLKKDFKFAVEFEDLENGRFNNTEDVKYFGISEGTKTEASKQVEVLYYDSPEKFAVKLFAENDEVIICKGSKETTFDKIYSKMVDKSEEYEGKRTFSNGVDELKIPNIKFDTMKEFKVLENKEFQFSDGNTYEISQAIETIKFNLDKTGVELKSEAGMTVTLTSLPMEQETPKPRLFYADSSFTIFLKEAGQEKPYFSAHIDNIERYQ